MKNKKLISIVSLIFALLLVFTSCASKSGNNDDDGDEKESSSGSKMAKDNFYTKYDNIYFVGQFSNGLAPFMLYTPSGSMHMSGNYYWSGDYYFGYIDTKGRVVIEPTYECNPYDELPSFEWDYIRYGKSEDYDCLINKKGEIVYESGVDGVLRIGNVSEGYFWMETVKEDVSGSVYSVTYYRTSDLSAVATFENARAFFENSGDPSDSTLDSRGYAHVISGEELYYYYSSDLIYFNISEYDSTYVPSYTQCNVEIESISAFSDAYYCYYKTSGKNNDLGILTTVMLTNSNGTQFYSIVDVNGNVLIAPQQAIAFPIDTGYNVVNRTDRYEFCKNLCPAQDAESGFWGYIDPAGKWVIEPEYTSAEPFSSEGYATVNEKIVIDTKGKVILAPKGWKNEIVTSLSGKYKYEVDNSWISWYITFGEDGTLEIRESMSGGSSWNTGTYKIKGAKIIFENVGINYTSPIKGEGEYTFRKEGNKIYLDETVWVLVTENQ